MPIEGSPYQKKFKKIQKNAFLRVNENNYASAKKALEDLDVQYLLHVYQQDSNIAVRQAAAGIFKNLGCHKELIEVWYFILHLVFLTEVHDIENATMNCRVHVFCYDIDCDEHISA